jgi:hypothetical protein
LDHERPWSLETREVDLEPVHPHRHDVAGVGDDVDDRVELPVPPLAPAQVALGAPGLPAVLGDVQDHRRVRASAGARVGSAVAVVEQVDERRVGVGRDRRLPVVASLVHRALARPAGRRCARQAFGQADGACLGRGLERLDPLLGLLGLLLELLFEPLVDRLVRARPGSLVGFGRAGGEHEGERHEDGHGRDDGARSLEWMHGPNLSGP